MSGGDAHLTRVHESSLTRFAPSPRAPNAAASSQHRFPVRPSSFPRPKPRGNEPDHRTPAPSDPKIPQGWRWYPGLDRPPPPLSHRHRSPGAAVPPSRLCGSDSARRGGADRSGCFYPILLPLPAHLLPSAHPIGTENTLFFFLFFFRSVPEFSVWFCTRLWSCCSDGRKG